MHIHSYHRQKTERNMKSHTRYGGREDLTTASHLTWHRSRRSELNAFVRGIPIFHDYGACCCCISPVYSLLVSFFSCFLPLWGWWIWQMATSNLGKNFFSDSSLKIKGLNIDEMQNLNQTSLLHLPVLLRLRPAYLRLRIFFLGFLFISLGLETGFTLTLCLHFVSGFFRGGLKYFHYLQRIIHFALLFFTENSSFQLLHYLSTRNAAASCNAYKPKQKST